MIFNKFFCCFKKKQKQEYIYILELISNKWYVGRTKNIEDRLEAHNKGMGAEFTKIYKVKSLYKLCRLRSNFDEDNTVKEYMMKYGIDSVRGGTYSTLNIDNATKRFLQNEFNHYNNSCFRCGSTQHYIRECQKDNTIVTFGKYKNQPIKNVPMDYINWCRGIKNPGPNVENFLKIIDLK